MITANPASEVSRRGAASIPRPAAPPAANWLPAEARFPSLIKETVAGEIDQAEERGATAKNLP